MADGMPRSISDAAAFVSAALTPKPELMVHADLTVTARAALDVLRTDGKTFERGGQLVRLIDRPDDVPRVQTLGEFSLINSVHELVQPGRMARGKKDAPPTFEPTTLPKRCASLALADAGAGFPVLDGVTTAPLLTADGTILNHAGYHSESRMWCAAMPDVSVPAQPTRNDAERALLLIRRKVATFAFGDSQRIQRPGAASLVDLTKPPGADESAFLHGLLTAVCRPSLPLAPGLKIDAPAVSGAGVGKGLAARAICAIAFGTKPAAFTAGDDKAELEKRLGAVLMEAVSAVLLDNFNGTLKSASLASVLTERPAWVRVLGRSEMVHLNPVAFFVITGNGLTLAEDLARRFLSCHLDANTEDPEARPFDPGFLESVLAERATLLSAALTIWRWGRQNAATLKRGRPLGSYETWAKWVRDPLLALGCPDPVERIAETKADDPMRRRLADLFAAWWVWHHDMPITAATMHDDVRAIADPQNRGRQFVATFLAKTVGTRNAGFVVTSQRPNGKWNATTYAIKRTDIPSPTAALHEVTI